MDNKYFDLISGLCNVLNSRLFVGVPCVDLIGFHKSMSSDIMHYIPVAELRSAIGMANGAYITGNSAVVIANHFDLTEDVFKFNLINNVPIFVITSTAPKVKNKGTVVIDCRSSLKGLEKAIKQDRVKIVNIIIV